MCKYTFKLNIALILRMYQDHGYTVEDIVLRLRYPNNLVQEIVHKYG